MVAIVGPVASGVPNTISPTEYACEWTAAPDHQTTVGVGVNFGNTSARAAFDAVPGDAQQGVGDDARWEADTNRLHVLSGSYILDISIFDLSPGSDALSLSKAIAQKMLPRLP